MTLSWWITGECPQGRQGYGSRDMLGLPRPWNYSIFLPTSRKNCGIKNLESICLRYKLRVKKERNKNSRPDKLSLHARVTLLIQVKHIPVYSDITKFIINQKFSTDEIKSAIDALKNNKSPGIYVIPAEFVECCKDILAEDITMILNYVLEERTVPYIWTEGLRFAALGLRSLNLESIIPSMIIEG